MSTSFEKCSLFLHPEKQSTRSSPALITAIITALKNIGLIANPINNQENHFYTGDAYLDHIAYLGCAPHIQFKASDRNENFCFIKIRHYNQKQLIVSQIQAKPPQCPECKKSIKNWSDIIIDTKLFCEHCKTPSNIEDYNWRKMGGYAQLFIEITDIFPKEAIPQPLLLDELSKITQTDWQYFYSCS